MIPCLLFINLQAVFPEGAPVSPWSLTAPPEGVFRSRLAPLQGLFLETFEAVLRIGDALSGFPPAHQLLKSHPQPLSVQPLTLP